MWSLLLLLPTALATEASVAFSFEPHLVTLTQSDAELEAYGFAPVSSGFVPMYGVRARLRHESGLVTGMAMSMAFASSAAEGNPVPTTTSWTRMAGVVGYGWTERWHTELDVGFGSLFHTVGSTSGGGALLYLGPYAQPKVAFRILTEPTYLEVGAGYLLHKPLSTPHEQPLWEEEFKRPLIHGLSLAITIGMGAA